MSESFLPENYKEPTKSNYMKFEMGSNRFRVLAPATLGNEYWTEEIVDGVKKTISVRQDKDAAIPMDKVVTDKFGNLAVNFFWAFPVYNFSAEKIQILQIKQKSVRDGMQGFLKNKMWGSVIPMEYNFEVVQSKKADGKTEYQVIAEPKEALDKDILAKFKSLNLDMSVWMAGNDPFSAKKVEAVDEIGF